MTPAKHLREIRRLLNDRRAEPYADAILALPTRAERLKALEQVPPHLRVTTKAIATEQHQSRNKHQ